LRLRTDVVNPSSFINRTTRRILVQRGCSVVSATNNNREVEEVLALLCVRFPKTFFMYQGKRKPLKVGIRREVEDALGGEVELVRLRRALKFYAMNPGYLKSQKVGAKRIDLSGNPVGIVSESEAKNAAAALKAIIEEKKEKKRDGLSALRQAARKRREAASTGGGA
jgi:sRNA-binding protein